MDKEEVLDRLREDLEIPFFKENLRTKSTVKKTIRK